MNNKLIGGLHHITALGDDAMKNAAFYSGILGLRLVKKTINFDDPGVYHLYYGNEAGSPGTIMTFFPYQGLRKGRHGNGQVTTTSFSAADTAMIYWIERLQQSGLKVTGPFERFGDMVIGFEDVHGLDLELVFNKNDKRIGFANGTIPQEYAIKGFFGITLSEERQDRTMALLTEGLEHKLMAEEGNRMRFSTGNSPVEFTDIIINPASSRGLSGSGTIHHVAFAVANDASQLEVRNRLLRLGVDVTPVIDRQYFNSVYFREPGGILFEIATVPPGFAVDEEPRHLGEHLKLPSWLESSRREIEDRLGPLEVPVINSVPR